MFGMSPSAAKTRRSNSGGSWEAKRPHIAYTRWRRNVQKQDSSCPSQSKKLLQQLWRAAETTHFNAAHRKRTKVWFFFQKELLPSFVPQMSGPERQHCLSKGITHPVAIKPTGEHGQINDRSDATTVEACRPVRPLTYGRLHFVRCLVFPVSIPLQVCNIVSWQRSLSFRRPCYLPSSSSWRVTLRRAPVRPCCRTLTRLAQRNVRVG